MGTVTEEKGELFCDGMKMHLFHSSYGCYSAPSLNNLTPTFQMYVLLGSNILVWKALYTQTHEYTIKTIDQVIPKFNVIKEDNGVFGIRSQTFCGSISISLLQFLFNTYGVGYLYSHENHDTFMFNSKEDSAKYMLYIDHLIPKVEPCKMHFDNVKVYPCLI